MAVHCLVSYVIHSTSLNLDLLCISHISVMAPQKRIFVQFEFQRYIVVKQFNDFTRICTYMTIYHVLSAI